MATILNIETSSRICSVALSKDGAIEFELDDDKGMNHAECLAPFVESCMGEAKRRGYTIDAVAVSIGPGSYTGLRIGLSLAKGLASSLDIPLIGLSTLKILAVKAMFRNMEWEGDETIACMIDARRMEVFGAVFDFSLNEIVPEAPYILTEESFPSLCDRKKVIFIGDGTDKYRTIYNSKNAIWLSTIYPHARDMIALSEKYYREGNFIDVAYSVPNYLKDYHTTLSKNKVLHHLKP